MDQTFKDPLHDRLGTWPIAYIPYGGPDRGAVVRIAEVVGDGGDDEFHHAWTKAADRMAADADAALARGHRESARESLLQAACCYGKAYHPLFGKPVDPRLIASSRLQLAAFDRAMSLGEEPVSPFRIPFEGRGMLAYLIPAMGQANQRRPLLILTNGYDGSITDLYFASAVAASRRGYHCLIFDGPGQGEMLIEQGVPLRPDWESVINAVIDFALSLPNVDAARIALNGWSLGGYLAPRAASGAPRLAACIADPAQRCVADGFRAYAMKLGASADAAMHLGDLDQSLLDRLENLIKGDRTLQWSVVKRGFWVNGVESLRDYLRSVETFDMGDRIEDIRCPTLVTFAEKDPLAIGVQKFFDVLRCPKQLIRFTAEEGAADHCEMGNRSLLNRRTLDWLDEVLAPSNG